MINQESKYNVIKTMIITIIISIIIFRLRFEEKNPPTSTSAYRMSFTFI